MINELISKTIKKQILQLKGGALIGAVFHKTTKWFVKRVIGCAKRDKERRIIVPRLSLRNCFLGTIIA